MLYFSTFIYALVMFGIISTWLLLVFKASSCFQSILLRFQNHIQVLQLYHVVYQNICMGDFSEFKK